MSWDKSSNEQKPDDWHPQTPKVEHGFFCRECNGSGLVPVCVTDRRGVANTLSATCECQAGRYEAEIREHSNNRSLRLEDARRRDLVPPHPTSFSAYWLHAKLTEARHDAARHGDDDDWHLRLLEYAATLTGTENQSEAIFAWVMANPRPTTFKTKRTPKQIYEEVMP